MRKGIQENCADSKYKIFFKKSKKTLPFHILIWYTNYVKNNSHRKGFRYYEDHSGYQICRR